MNLLLLFLLFQDRPIEASIDAFIKGDAAAREELVKLGIYAIRPLQRARDKAPEKIDALVFELKKGVAFPQPAQFDADLGGRRGMGGPVSARIVGSLTRGVMPCFLDPVDAERLKAARISVAGNTVREVAEEFCRATGLDYGYFHGALVFAHPDRLWPEAPPPDKGAVTGAALERAKALVEQLNHELLETREAASRNLLKLGRGLVPFLDEQLKRPEPEIVARCRILIQELTPKTGLYGRPAACRQTLDDSGKRVLRQLSDSKFNLRVDNQTITRIIEIVNASQPIVCEIPDELGKKTSSIEVRDMSAMDFLSLLTQSLGLDFMVQGTGIRIDTREAIDKLVPKPK